MRRRDFLVGSAAIVGCSRGGPRLNVYNWSDYIAPDTIANFERETGIRVRYGTYESAPELLAKIITGNSGWDVVFPSAEHVRPLTALGLLADLRHKLLPGLDALHQAFQRPPWDPELRTTVPYMHGATGIVYQKSLQLAPQHWSDLWNPALGGKITMLDEASEVLGVCLQMAGHSLNSADPSELRAAQQDAIRQKKLVRAYLNAEVRDQLIAGDVTASQVWAVTAAQAMAGAPGRLGWVLPSEGFPRYADTVAILRESARVETAHRFLDYLLRPAVAANIARVTRTATVNAGALKLLTEEDRNSPVLYPAPELLEKGEWFEPQPAASQRLRDRLWTEVKSA